MVIGDTGERLDALGALGKEGDTLKTDHPSIQGAMTASPNVLSTRILVGRHNFVIIKLKAMKNVKKQNERKNKVFRELCRPDGAGEWNR